ncbi:MAG: DnaD domain protein [Clostridium beijerinckii]
MADKRMFSKTIIDSDAFLDMPLSTQTLYFHLAMRADDDGFINNPRKIQRMIGCGEDDLKLLIAKKFVIIFESGVIVIKHWKIHNYIQKDRYKETVYREEKSMLSLKENKAYTLGKINSDNSLGSVNDSDKIFIEGRTSCKSVNEDKVNKLKDSEVCTQSVYKTDAQIRLDKVSIYKSSVEVDKNIVEVDKNSRDLEKNRQDLDKNFRDLDKNSLEIGKNIRDKDNIKSLSVVVSSNNQVFKHFEKCGFIMSPKLMELIAADIEVYSAKWLIDAATESMKRGKINYKYLLAILQNWKADGRDRKAALHRANASAYKDFGDSVLDN